MKASSASVSTCAMPLSDGGNDVAPPRSIWTPSQDEKLILVIKQEENQTNEPVRNWVKIAYILMHDHDVPRTAKQCRERWHNHLNPNVKKGPWSDEELLILHEGVKKFGQSWSSIASLLPGRTDNNIKNKYYCELKKKTNKKITLESFKDSEPISHENDNNLINIESRNQLKSDDLLYINTPHQSSSKRLKEEEEDDDKFNNVNDETALPVRISTPSPSPSPCEPEAPSRKYLDDIKLILSSQFAYALTKQSDIDNNNINTKADQQHKFMVSHHSPSKKQKEFDSITMAIDQNKDSTSRATTVRQESNFDTISINPTQMKIDDNQQKNPASFDLILSDMEIQQALESLIPDHLSIPSSSTMNDDLDFDTNGILDDLNDFIHDDWKNKFDPLPL